MSDPEQSNVKTRRQAKKVMYLSVKWKHKNTESRITVRLNNLSRECNQWSQPVRGGIGQVLCGKFSGIHKNVADRFSATS